MTFETLVAGESRQINGPLAFVQVLSAGVGAAMKIDQIDVPVSATLKLQIRANKRWPFDRLNLTGPITVYVSKTYDEPRIELVV